MQLPQSPEAAVRMWVEITGVDRADLAVQASNLEISLDDFCLQSLANHYIGKTCQNFLGTAMAVAKPVEQTPDEFERAAEGVLLTLRRIFERSQYRGNNMAVLMVEESARAALSAVELYKSKNFQENN